MLGLVLAYALILPVSCVRAEEPFDPQIRAAMLKRKDGQITHIETAYNDIFVIKYQNLLTMTFHKKKYYFEQSQINLADPDDLPVAYIRALSIATAYPQYVKRVLILGLGGGALSTYLGRFLPDAVIDTVELDPGVIDTAKKYFGVRETSKLHFVASDGRVFLNRHKEPYDLIAVDAFQGSNIPFHMMTKEFYGLVREHLSPAGVAAFNIVSGTRLYDSSLITLKNTFGRIDLYRAGSDLNVIVITPRDSVEDGETLNQKAVAAQERYNFRFDVGKLAADWRIGVPKAMKGELLTDDFAPVNVLDTYGRRYRQKN
ncbi:MAG TPA: fused MFS/spermidine synthase [Xanthobacteraceae bacterium]